MLARPKQQLGPILSSMLTSPKKNAAVDEGVRDILTAIIDLLWSQKSYRLAGNTNGQYKIEAGLAERLRNLSSKLVNTETNDNSGKRNTRDKSHIDLPRKRSTNRCLSLKTRSSCHTIAPSRTPI